MLTIRRAANHRQAPRTTTPHFRTEHNMGRRVFFRRPSFIGGHAGRHNCKGIGPCSRLVFDDKNRAGIGRVQGMPQPPKLRRHLVCSMVFPTAQVSTKCLDADTFLLEHDSEPFRHASHPVVVVVRKHDGPTRVPDTAKPSLADHERESVRTRRPNFIRDGDFGNPLSVARSETQREDVGRIDGPRCHGPLMPFLSKAGQRAVRHIRWHRLICPPLPVCCLAESELKGPLLFMS